MLRFMLALLLAVAGVAACKGGEVIKIAAAYEVPTTNDAERAQLLEVMQEHAARSGFHVDYESDQELAQRPEWARRKFNAAVWAGANDEEYIASAMSQPSDLNRVWLTFNVGRNPDQRARFRTSLMEAVRARWPETKELPVLDGETIPLPHDLIVDGDKYILDPLATDRYNEPNAPSAPPAPSS